MQKYIVVNFMTKVEFSNVSGLWSVANYIQEQRQLSPKELTIKYSTGQDYCPWERSPYAHVRKNAKNQENAMYKLESFGGQQHCDKISKSVWW